ncbi:MAG: hypothetical protein KME06_01660 [Kastovskya adunca ATA6-11-RM4]|jgi:hypothetical protein|nr:hypothetical protein [Kastovskya adunca ATA6-11-RM4]
MSAKGKVTLAILAGVLMSAGAGAYISTRDAEVATTPTLSGEVGSPSESVPVAPNRRQANQNTPTQTATERVQYEPIDLEATAKPLQLAGSDPEASALAAFGISESEGNLSQTVTVDYPQPDQAVVILTQTGVADDSVNGFRYRLEMESTTPSPTNPSWQTVWAGRQFKCQPSRGHQDWSTELCL